MNVMELKEVGIPMSVRFADYCFRTGSSSEPARSQISAMVHQVVLWFTAHALSCDFVSGELFAPTTLTTKAAAKAHLLSNLNCYNSEPATAHNSRCNEGNSA